MHRRIVDGDDQIQFRNLGGELIQVGKRVGIVPIVNVDFEIVPRIQQLCGAVAVLQIDEVHPRYFKEGLPFIEVC